ncbi:hypothetical protein AQ487_00030 [Enterococcus faecalis]|nr:helix-turn-helix domain-containing protein [Enterococcus faecalis]KXF70029.1 hypothetical protein AQ486_10680 [Enterococcus faecalis]KXF74533.1 hypothetical protein AQ487_00030 [Enterococcus faecalis]MBC2817119.1 hypothetical protein [Enterococcus faecalis]MBC2832877.1 hypothetical protein [Enterococcus faecalis]
MKVAYARILSIDQNLDRQIQEFKKLGAEKIFVEKKSGATMIAKEYGITRQTVYRIKKDYE